MTGARGGRLFPLLAARGAMARGLPQTERTGMTTTPFDERAGQIWMDGALVPWGAARVHVLSHGLHYASSVFEGERAYGGEIFRLEEHTERLFFSAGMLDMKIPYTEEEINAACREAVAANGLADAYVRPVVWRGPGSMSLDAPEADIHVAVAAWEWPPLFSAETRLKGARLEIAEWRRPSPATIPAQAKAAGLYMICTLAKHAAARRGFDDALFLDWKGRVAEATGANIFLVRDNQIHTPIADCFLDGITRRTAMELARARGYELVERRMEPNELGDFEECFLTGTAAEITSVAAIGDVVFTGRDTAAALLDDYHAAVMRRAASA